MGLTANNYALYLIIFALFVLMSVIIVVRRLHDLNLSAYWTVTAFIPYINLVFLACLLFIKGTNGYNRFGLDPLTEKNS